MKRAFDWRSQGQQFKTALKAAAKGVHVEIVKRSDQENGSVILPNRWVVELAFAWSGRCRRIAEDGERLSRKAFASIRLMLQEPSGPA